MLVTTSWHGVDLQWAYADLLRGIQRRTGCPHRARDVLHDSLIRLALATMRAPITQPHAYLRTVAGSVLIDCYRDDARWLPLPDHADRDGGTVGYVPSAERMAQLRACLKAAQRVLDRLPPRRREVFWLFRIDGFSCRAIAEHLGLSVRTVENHVMRTMVDLRAAEEEMM